jgi:hypothetical protein
MRGFFYVPTKFQGVRENLSELNRAGRKPGAKQRRFSIASMESCKPLAMKVIMECLTSEDLEDRKWVTKEILPYIYPKQAQQLNLANHEGKSLHDGIEFIVISR